MNEMGQKGGGSAILDRLPEPEAIRSRLVDLTTERNFLKSLLRIMETQHWREGKAQEQRRAGAT
jgi:hypothetical protein